ncbi:hypothetical protein [Xenorhabdus kozodoii]|uniref:Transglutaminase-like domain-containing protein n=1 Tax=Xenorhabdus kozodoii TaxID=351676 RepID=A0A2D0L692_9GAMM|nr:hypothetical protein [Xenorhabdus kozodoii]PHM70917.1 hypothetical protein Xkoz_02926 [Xenorhabdus kozodoii]
MSMRTLYNLFMAKKAINYVNNSVEVISPNQIPKIPELLPYRDDMKLQLHHMRKMIDQTTRKNVIRDNIKRDEPHFYQKLYGKRIPIRSAYATEWHVGNCGEKAAIAFAHLKFNRVKPLDFFSIDIDNLGNDHHSIVVIGRVTGNSTDPATWGREAVICDPWDKTAYPAHLYPDKVAFKGRLKLRYRYE